MKLQAGIPNAYGNPEQVGEGPGPWSLAKPQPAHDPKVEPLRETSK